MRCLGAAVLGLLAAASHIGVAAADVTDAIKVEGNRRIDADVIRAHFRDADKRGAGEKHGPGEKRGAENRGLGDRHGAPADPLSPAAIDAALKELYATGLFEDVTITRSATGVTVSVVEAPVVERVQFEGNKQLQDKDLTKEITLQPHRPATKAAVQGDVVRLMERYRRSGHYEAKITPKMVTHGEGRADLVFEITEGVKTGVKHIAFSGNRAFSDYRLMGLIKTSESGWLSFLKTSDVYDPDLIEADTDLLRRFYLKNGFVDARVSGGGVYDPALQGFVVGFKIDEGERYHLGAVDIVSRVAALETAPLRDALRLAPGQVYDGNAVDKTVDAITLAAAKRDAPFVKVRPQISRNVAAKTVDLAFVVDDGPRVYIERIAIRGNIVTHDDVIRREFDVAEGDPYNRDAIARSERRLKALRLFKSVKTSTAPGSAPDRLVLNVDVEEDHTGDISFSGGYSTAAGIIGEVSISERNLMGVGQFVKVSATVGQYLHGGTIAFADPYVLDQRLSLGVEGSYQEVLANDYQSYGSTTIGGTVKLGAPLADGITTQVHYSLINQGISLSTCSLADPPPGCLAASDASAAVKQAVLNGSLWISSVGSSVIYSTLDDAKNPHDGVRAQFNQDVAGLGGDADFLKSTGDLRYYHDLGNDVVAVGRLQGGSIEPYGGQPLPLLSGFFGGPQLVRGFAPNGFGPRDITPGTSQDNIGGTAYWATSAELQAPIPGLPPEIALKAAGFADAGSLWGYRGATSFPALSQSLTVADTRQIRSSVGAGLIWDSPFGALRVDYAVPITKAPYDITQRWHFGAGPF